MRGRRELSVFLRFANSWQPINSANRPTPKIWQRKIAALATAPSSTAARSCPCRRNASHAPAAAKPRPVARRKLAKPRKKMPLKPVRVTPSGQAPQFGKRLRGVGQRAQHGGKQACCQHQPAADMHRQQPQQHHGDGIEAQIGRDVPVGRVKARQYGISLVRQHEPARQVIGIIQHRRHINGQKRQQQRRYQRGQPEDARAAQMKFRRVSCATAFRGRSAWRNRCAWRRNWARSSDNRRADSIWRDRLPASCHSGCADSA